MWSHAKKRDVPTCLCAHAFKTKLWSGFNGSCCLRCLLLLCSTHFIDSFFVPQLYRDLRKHRQTEARSATFSLCGLCVGFIPNTEACRTALLATQRYRSRCILHILFLALHFSIFFLSFLISHYRFLVLLMFLMVSVKQNLGSLSIQESDCMASGDFEQQ